MRSYDDRPRGVARVILMALALMTAAGCAHAPRHAEPALPSEPDHEAPAPPPQRANLPPDQAPEPEPQSHAPGRLDPSEEITPQELATLPDPVPGGSAPTGGARAPQREASQGISTPGTVPGPSESDSGAPAPSEGLWRVQIYASERRSEADRVGRSAARRLGVPLVIEREGGVYKVRLGAFTSEAEAQELRDRAVRAGYPGAFRTRAGP